MAEDVLTPEEIKKAALENVKKTAAEAAKAEAEKVTTEKVDKALEDIFAKMKERDEAQKAANEEAKKALDKEIQALQAEIKKAVQTSQKKKDELPTFGDLVDKALKDNLDAIQGFKPGSSEIALAIKDATDMSWTDFTNYGKFTDDVQSTLVPAQSRRIWLADLLPNMNSIGNSITYPKRNGQEGEVDVWEGGSKSQVQFKLTSQSAHFKWLAGFAIVPREMLDDVAWLSSYLRAELLTSLKIAENDFILNGTSNTNPVDGLLKNAQAYDGDFEDLIEIIIDSAYGQIPTETDERYFGNTLVLNHRSAVAVGLTKAEGSGQYNLPDGTIRYVNGQLTVGGLTVAQSNAITAGDSLTFDSNATALIRRLAPEIRLFEDATLAKKNQVMFRIEERATFVSFDDDAIVHYEAQS